MSVIINKLVAHNSREKLNLQIHSLTEYSVIHFVAVSFINNLFHVQK